MKRDDIIRMAREAGYKHPDAVGDAEDFAYFDFERFATLAYEAGRKDENEAAIEIVARHGGSVEIEAAIRARGQE